MNVLYFVHFKIAIKKSGLQFVGLEELSSDEFPAETAPQFAAKSIFSRPWPTYNTHTSELGHKNRNTKVYANLRRKIFTLQIYLPIQRKN